MVVVGIENPSWNNGLVKILSSTETTLSTSPLPAPPASSSTAILVGLAASNIVDPTDSSSSLSSLTSPFQTPSSGHNNRSRGREAEGSILSNSSSNNIDSTENNSTSTPLPPITATTNTFTFLSLDNHLNHQDQSSPLPITSSEGRESNSVSTSSTAAVEVQSITSPASTTSPIPSPSSSPIAPTTSPIPSALSPTAPTTSQITPTTSQLLLLHSSAQQQQQLLQLDNSNNTCDTEKPPSKRRRLSFTSTAKLSHSTSEKTKQKEGEEETPISDHSTSSPSSDLSSLLFDDMKEPSGSNNSVRGSSGNNTNAISILPVSISTTTSTTSSGSHSGGRSVASRFKKNLASPSGNSSNHQNGSSGNMNPMDKHFENGLSPNANNNNNNNHNSSLYGELLLPITSTPVDLSQTDVEMLRIIGQHLKGLGMNSTANMLMAESRTQLELAAAGRLRKHALAGRWDMVLADLKSVQPYLLPPAMTNVVHMKFLILQQKYLELVESGQVVEALTVLRTELSPLNYKVNRVHELSSFLMFNNSGAELARIAEWDGSDLPARQALLDKLQAFIPPSVMLPPKRLESLIEHGLKYQYRQCSLHNASLNFKHDPTASLLTDHKCTHHGFPSELRQTIQEHCDEVWCCFWSHSGRYLASCAKNDVVYVWELNPDTKTLTKYRTFSGHNYGVSYLAWSPDDKYLAAIGQEYGPDLWLWDVEKNEQRIHMKNQAEDCLSVVAWTPDGTRLVVGGIKGHFYHCDLDGNVLDSMEGVRIRSLWCKKDGKTILGGDSHDRIRAYTFDSPQNNSQENPQSQQQQQQPRQHDPINDCHVVIRERDPLIYFCLDRSERYALCTTKGQGLHLWDLETGTIVRRYRGSKHGDYITISCFGGHNQDFVSSGSEDHNVYIWQREQEEPVKILRGHTGVVNSVAWNPVDPTVLASASDDGTIKLWGPPLDHQRQQQQQQQQKIPSTSTNGCSEQSSGGGVGCSSSDWDMMDTTTPTAIASTARQQQNGGSSSSVLPLNLTTSSSSSAAAAAIAAVTAASSLSSPSSTSGGNTTTTVGPNNNNNNTSQQQQSGEIASRQYGSSSSCSE